MPVELFSSVEIQYLLRMVSALSRYFNSFIFLGKRNIVLFGFEAGSNDNNTDLTREKCSQNDL